MICFEISDLLIKLNEFIMTMLNDITLGQYFPGDSLVHRLDPRTKIISLFLLMSALLVAFEPLLLLGFGLIVIVALIFSRLPIAIVFKNLRPFIWLFLLTMVVHLLWTPGREIARLPVLNLTITWEGFATGLVYSIRLALLILLAALLTLSTSPMELTEALDRLFRPLKRLGIPTHEIVMMLTLSLRFIPTLLEEAQRLRNAQVSRGAAFEGSIVKRIRSIGPLVIPLFVAAFRRADELAAAMDARCYTGGDGRTSYRRLHFSTADYAILACSIIAFAALVVVKMI